MGQVEWKAIRGYLSNNVRRKMKHSKIPNDLKNPVEARSYVRRASEIYRKDNDFDALMKALMDVVYAQGGHEKKLLVANINTSNFHQGRDRPVTQEKMKVMERIGLFEEEAE